MTNSTNSYRPFLNSLWPRGAVWRHRSVGPHGRKSLPEQCWPILIIQEVTFFWGKFHTRYPNHQSQKLSWKLVKKYSHGNTLWMRAWITAIYFYPDCQNNKLSLLYILRNLIIPLLFHVQMCVYCRILVSLYCIWSLKCSCWTWYASNLGVFGTVYFIHGCKTHYVAQEYVVCHHNNVIYCIAAKLKKRCTEAKRGREILKHSLLYFLFSFWFYFWFICRKPSSDSGNGWVPNWRQAII